MHICVYIYIYINILNYILYTSFSYFIQPSLTQEFLLFLMSLNEQSIQYFIIAISL